MSFCQQFFFFWKSWRSNRKMSNLNVNLLLHHLRTRKKGRNYFVIVKYCDQSYSHHVFKRSPCFMEEGEANAYCWVLLIATLHRVCWRVESFFNSSLCFIGKSCKFFRKKVISLQWRFLQIQRNFFPNDSISYITIKPFALWTKKMLFYMWGCVCDT